MSIQIQQSRAVEIRQPIVTRERLAVSPFRWLRTAILREQFRREADVIARTQLLEQVKERRRELVRLQ
jgi:hypothetical protein